MGIKLKKNFNCDKTKQLKFLTKIKIQIVTKLKKNKILTNLENLNCDKTKKMN